MTEGTVETPTREFDTTGLPIHVRIGKDGSEQRLRTVSKHPERLPNEIYEEIMALVRSEKITTTTQMRNWFRTTFANGDQLFVSHGLAANFRNLDAGVGRERAVREGNRQIIQEEQEAQRQRRLEIERAAKEARAKKEAEIRENIGDGLLKHHPELTPLLLDGRLPDLMEAKDGELLPVHEWTSNLTERFLSGHENNMPALHVFLDRLAERITSMDGFYVPIEARYAHLKALIACGANPQFEATFKEQLQHQQDPRCDMQTIFYLDSIAHTPRED